MKGATWHEISGSEGAQISMSSKGTKIKGIFGWKYLIKSLSPAIEKSNALLKQKSNQITAKSVWIQESSDT